MASAMKAFFAIFRLLRNWDWESLPEAYRSSAYLSTDSIAINDYFQGTGSTEVQEESSISTPIPNEKPMHSTIPVKKVYVHVDKCIYSLDVHTHVEQRCPTLYVYHSCIYMWSMILYMYLYVYKPVQYME